MGSNILDANAVLRYLLRDSEEQYLQVDHIIRTEYCQVSLEVLAEVSYVLEGVYSVPRSAIIGCFRKLSQEIIIVNGDVLLRALEVYDKSPKIDFVDCLMYGYQSSRGYNVVTFDKKLKTVLSSGTMV